MPRTCDESEVLDLPLLEKDHLKSREIERNIIDYSLPVGVELHDDIIFDIFPRECLCFLLLPDIGVFIQNHALGFTSSIPKSALETDSQVGVKLHFKY